MKYLIISLVTVLFIISLPELITLQVALQTQPGISPLLGSTFDGLMYVMGIAAIVIPSMLLLSWRK
jgi:hypothetical protein